MSVYASAAEMALVPVSASGPHTIVDNEIILYGADQVVTLEIRISDWGPERLEAYQVEIDPSGTMSGDTGTLLPYAYDNPDFSAYCYSAADCTGDQICWPSPYGAFCAGPNHHPEDGAFIDKGRADYVFKGLPTLAAVDHVGWDPLHPLGFTYAALSLGGVQSYVPPPKSGGTLTLVAPPDAAGTFTVGLREYPHTHLILETNAITSADCTGALITVLPAECGNGICDSGEDIATCPEDCAPPPIPAASAWGLVVMTLLALTTARITSIRRRAAM
jgi:hypothetical protein